MWLCNELCRMFVLFVWWSSCIGVEVGCLVVFFFFKQKTAYEMRISDWSSDVCSSDLEAAFRAALARMADDPALRAAVGAANRRVAAERFDESTMEIGRASCRERVCQYV